MARYKTFARTVPSEQEITKAFLALFKHFNWRKFSIIYEQQSANEELFLSIKVCVPTAHSPCAEGFGC